MMFASLVPRHARGSPLAWVPALLLSLLFHVALLASSELWTYGRPRSAPVGGMRSAGLDGRPLRWVSLPAVTSRSEDVSATGGAAAAVSSAEATEGHQGSGRGGQPIYFLPQQLDGPLLPVSAPDVSRLQPLIFSGEPIRLRLWISAQGRVERIDVLQARPADRDAVAEVQAMYYDTAYMPPQRQGQAVAARMDIELSFTPLSVEKGPIIPLDPAQATP